MRSASEISSSPTSCQRFRCQRQKLPNRCGAASIATSGPTGVDVVEPGAMLGNRRPQRDVTLLELCKRPPRQVRRLNQDLRETAIPLGLAGVDLAAYMIQPAFAQAPIMPILLLEGARRRPAHGAFGDV